MKHRLDLNPQRSQVCKVFLFRRLSNFNWIFLSCFVLKYFCDHSHGWIPPHMSSSSHLMPSTGWVLFSDSCCLPKSWVKYFSIDGDSAVIFKVFSKRCKRYSILYRRQVFCKSCKTFVNLQSWLLHLLSLVSDTECMDSSSCQYLLLSLCVFTPSFFFNNIVHMGKYVQEWHLRWFCHACPFPMLSIQ